MRRSLYVATGVAALLTIAIGFAPTFYLRPATRPPLPPLVVVHGIVFTAWVMLFLVQASLVAAGRTDLHRRLGVAGAGLAVLIVVLGAAIAIPAARRGNLPGDPLAFLLVILTDLIEFAIFASAAIYFRRTSETHKRLMLLALTSIMPPAISRWPIAANHPPVVAVVQLLFLLPLPLSDWVRGRRLHPVSLWGGLAIVISIPVRFALAQSAGWHRLARWLIS